MPLVDSIDYYDAAINRVQKSANSLVGTEREVAQEQLKRLQIQKALANGDYTGGLNLQASSLKELKDLWADANTTANEYLATLLKFNDLGESEGLKRQQEQLIDYGVVLGSLTTDIATSIGEAIGDEDITADFKTMILEPLASALTQLGSLLIAYGFASDAFKKAWGNPYTAIAAGAALIAVGSAISAVEAMTDILHIAICRYRYAADLIDVEVAEVSRKRVALLRYLRTDEYLEARDYIVAHLMDLLKNIKERVGLEVCEVD